MKANQQPFFDWVYTLLSSNDTKILGVYLIVGFIGIFFHYFKQWMTNSINGNFWTYLIGDCPRHTAAMIMTFVGSGIAYVYSGALDSSSWLAILGVAFSTGYSVDSAVNKGSKPSQI